MIDVHFEGVSKIYKIRHEVPDAGPGLIGKIKQFRGAVTDFWAVRNVSFEVTRGEALGIIGHNGSGKSTILKMLSNITRPTMGQISIEGRLSALIEVGSGFHPDLTGRENVYLSGSILGMRRSEIAKKMESIVEFAGVSEFLDTPVKRFSSGMYVRLGFSIAAHLEPDILLLDEVLAVGDAAFQTKCLKRIEELKQSGVTIVFISHDLGAVERLCDRALLMKRGTMIAVGNTSDVIQQYQQVGASARSNARQENTHGADAEILNLTFCDEAGTDSPAFRTGDSLIARLEYRANKRVQDAVFQIVFYTADREVLCEFTSEVTGDVLNLDPGSGAIDFYCPQLGLLPGLYYTDVYVRQRQRAAPIDWQYSFTMLRVDPGKVVKGRFYLPTEWRHGIAQKQ